MCVCMCAYASVSVCVSVCVFVCILSLTPMNPKPLNRLSLCLHVNACTLNTSEVYLKCVRTLRVTLYVSAHGILDGLV